MGELKAAQAKVKDLRKAYDLLQEPIGDLQAKAGQATEDVYAAALAGDVKATGAAVVQRLALQAIAQTAKDKAKEAAEALRAAEAELVELQASIADLETQIERDRRYPAIRQSGHSTEFVAQMERNEARLQAIIG